MLTAAHPTQAPVVVAKKAIPEKAPEPVPNREEDEPLLRENPNRFVVFPIQYHDIWQFYKKAEGEHFGGIHSAGVDRFVFDHDDRCWRDMVTE